MKKKINYWLIGAVILFGVMIAFAGYKLFEMDAQTRSIDQISESVKDQHSQTDENGFSLDWPAVQQEYPGIKAWLVVPGCNISAPVFQADDNSYYLDHDGNGNYNPYGAIFMDSQSPSDLSGFNTLIYGHSTDDGTMFTSLDRFDDESFFASHLYFYLLTPQGNYRCPILAFSRIESGQSAFTIDPGDYRNDVFQSIQEEAIYRRDLQFDQDSARLVSLSTCDLDYGFYSTQRLVLTGLLEKTDQPIPES